LEKWCMKVLLKSFGLIVVDISGMKSLQMFIQWLWATDSGFNIHTTFRAWWFTHIPMSQPVAQSSMGFHISGQKKCCLTTIYVFAVLKFPPTAVLYISWRIFFTQGVWISIDMAFLCFILSAVPAGQGEAGCCLERFVHCEPIPFALLPEWTPLAVILAIFEHNYMKYVLLQLSSCDLAVTIPYHLVKYWVSNHVSCDWDTWLHSWLISTGFCLFISCLVK
jgi:hypothetical protein